MSDELPEVELRPASDETQDTRSSTERSGKAGESVDNPVDPVKEALHSAQRISRRKNTGRKRKGGRGSEEAPQGGYSGAWPDALDPQPIRAVTAEFVADLGWEQPLSEARVFTDWAKIVGSDVAAHCTPTALRAGELRISAESTAWATQLRLLGATLLARIVAELGPQVVTKVVITGPVGPSWKHGRRSVHGARGPRDTYG